jgi:hypothetical protein
MLLEIREIRSQPADRFGGRVNAEIEAFAEFFSPGARASGSELIVFASLIPFAYLGG